MDQELKELIINIVKRTAKVSLPLTAAVSIIWDIPSGVSFLIGTFLALLGFAVSVVVTSRAVQDGKSIVLPLLLNFVKVILTAAVGTLLIMWQPVLGIFYIAGYTVIFIGMILYTRHLN